MHRILKLSTPVVLITFFGLIGLQLLQSCRHRIDYINGQITAYDNSTTVQNTIYGRVVDESGTPMENVTVSCGNTTTLTDVRGLFFFRNIVSPEHATTVVAKKQDYFHGSRTITVQKDGDQQIEITLLSKGLPKTFVSANGATVDFGNGMKITFNPSSIYNPATGNSHEGQVYIYARKIDPTSTLGRATMPGDLRGITEATSEERTLQSFGMMCAELTDINGNPLQIKSSAQANITLEIPSSLQSAAPAQIALWYYDEALGVWKEEGFAYKVAGQYEGSVKHFSFWNCDTPEAAINLQMNLVDQNNNALQGYVVKLTNTLNNDYRNGTTNSNGWVSGLVYANATLLLEIYNPANVCGASTPLLSQTVVTSSINMNLGTIVVTVPTGTCTFNGIVIDCTNLPSANAAVYVSPLNLLISANNLGEFSYTLPCVPSQPLTFTSYDLTNLVNGTSTATLVSGSNNLGNVYACGDVTPFLDLYLINLTNSNSDTFHFVAPMQTIGANVIDSGANSRTEVYASGFSNNYFTLHSSDTVVGTHPVTLAYFTGPSNFTDTQFTLQPGSTATYTSYPIFPGHLLGSFSINFVGVPSGHIYNAIGSFRAPRNN